MDLSAYQMLSSFCSKQVAVVSCRHDAFFFFHNINAFESEGNICVDLSAYENIRIIVQLHRAHLLYKDLDKIQPAIPRR